ncbi:gpn-loop gtpase 3 [Anaeramoeba ignava]|uniref:GPN-loop GTPase 3 n=1 Tax=Anaeramoeba ignava TaxID=1746090 RepID=A0A9Q0RB69_ANAIG|nr:gpn-loop gtpase 3 [Anaeramoeba ignava]
MGRKAQLVIGPAGSGKSTYTQTIQKHCELSRRTVHCINLDPAAEYFAYNPTIDIRDLISLEDVTEELNYGPNGGLVFCMEYFINNIEWFKKQIGEFEDDYLIIDCPGQIELYSHFSLMTKLIQEMQNWNYTVCGVYIIDCHFILEPYKFISGMLACLSSMIQLEIPFVNVISKMDLLGKQERKTVKKFISSNPQEMLRLVNRNNNPLFYKLNKAFIKLLQDFSLVGFTTLDITDEDSIARVLLQIDLTIQYGEDEEVYDTTNLPDENMDDFINQHLDN